MKVSKPNSSRDWIEDHIVVTSNSGRVMGEIISLHAGVSTSAGGESTLYMAQQSGPHYKAKVFNTMAEALQYLGISSKEQDAYYK